MTRLWPSPRLMKASQTLNRTTGCTTTFTPVEPRGRLILDMPARSVHRVYAIQVAGCSMYCCDRQTKAMLQLSDLRRCTLIARVACKHLDDAESSKAQVHRGPRAGLILPRYFHGSLQYCHAGKAVHEDAKYSSNALRSQFHARPELASARTTTGHLLYVKLAQGAAMASLTAAFGQLSLGRPCRTPLTVSASRLASSPALRGCQLLRGETISTSVATNISTAPANGHAGCQNIQQMPIPVVDAGDLAISMLCAL